MTELLKAIVDDTPSAVRKLLHTDPGLATARTKLPKLYQSGILHWLYAGDTALHLAAAGYRVGIVRMLLKAGADVNVMGKLRNARPLHYAADGYVDGPAWDEKRQVRTIQCLLEAGAQVDAQDKNGATALHRAVRNRCTSAVKCLLDAGANPVLKNKPGSTPFHLAVQNTGRGGSGLPKSMMGQKRIIQMFLDAGVPLSVQDGKGKTVLDCAKSDWIKQML